MVSEPIREKILLILADEETITRAELVEKLASEDEIPATDTDSLDISLHHHHLPKLSAENYIEYDARTGDVAIWRNPQQIRDSLSDE